MEEVGGGKKKPLALCKLGNVAATTKGRCRCLQIPPNRHPEPGVQVGEGRLALGSSDAR